jgi:hypothetical protein
LQERTELDIFLRQCIDDVRSDIVRHSTQNQRRTATSPRRDPLDTSLLDRQRVVEILQSKERVLKLLYLKTFPSKPTTMFENVTEEETAAMVVAQKQAVIVSSPSMAQTMKSNVLFKKAPIHADQG